MVLVIEGFGWRGIWVRSCAVCGHGTCAGVAVEDLEGVEEGAFVDCYGVVLAGRGGYGAGI